MCAIDGGERAEVYAWKVRRARRQHRCNECGRQIEQGERYEYASMIYDGFPSSYHTCGHCAVALAWLRENCGGFLHEGVWEDVREHADEYPKLAIGLLRLCVGMRRRWKPLRGDGLARLPRLPGSIASLMVPAPHGADFPGEGA